MSGEPDSHEVIDLALQEVGPVPDPCDGGDGGIVLSDAGLQADTGAVRQREQMVNDLEPLGVIRIVGGADVGDMVKGGRRIVVEESGHIHNPVRGYAGGDFRARLIFVHGKHRLRESAVQGFEYWMHILVNGQLLLVNGRL